MSSEEKPISTSHSRCLSVFFDVTDINGDRMLRFFRTCFVALLASTMFIPLQAQETQSFSVGSVVAEAGQTTSGYLGVPAGVDAGTRIPITVVHGATTGPVLALIAGTHGYEYPPITALQQVRRELDPAELSGTVIIVHVANVPSFLGRTIYYSPVDGKNLNRAYPGDPNGTVSERIAFLLTTEVISRADFMVDLHCGDGNESLRPYLYMAVTGDPELDNAIRGMALAFGIDHIVVDQTGLAAGPSVYTDKTALDRGIPAITTETGQLGSNDPVWVNMAVRGVWNLLRHLEMAEGEVESIGEVVWLEDYQVVTSPATGIFQAAVRDGYAIAEGGLLGVLVDLFGDPIQEIKAPFAGVVNYVVGTPPVSEGEPVAMVSRIRR
jgi:predicted deacylase